MSPGAPSDRAGDAGLAAPPPHHRPGGGFRNPWPSDAGHELLGFVRWQLDRLRRGRPDDPDPSVFPRAHPAFASPRQAPAAPGGPTPVAVTWVGHSTALVQLGGLNVLTDPIWSDRASPLAALGPRRWVPPGVALDALPPIDLVLVSHNHYDHLDEPTVRALAARWPNARWLAPLGLRDWLRARGAGAAAELDWWDEAHVPGPDASRRAGAGSGGADALAACVPAQHFSARGLGDRDATLWCGWLLSAGGRRVYFAGDSGYCPAFAEIGARYGPPDVALVPIGAYAPRWFMRRVHMDPAEAVRAFLDVRGAGPADGRRGVMVGTHWGTFKLTDEPMDEPPRLAREAWRGAGLAAEDLWVLRHGETRAL